MVTVYTLLMMFSLGILHTPQDSDEAYKNSPRIKNYPRIRLSAIKSSAALYMVDLADFSTGPIGFHAPNREKCF